MIRHCIDCGIDLDPLNGEGVAIPDEGPGFNPWDPPTHGFKLMCQRCYDKYTAQSEKRKVLAGITDKDKKEFLERYNNNNPDNGITDLTKKNLVKDYRQKNNIKSMAELQPGEIATVVAEVVTTGKHIISYADTKEIKQYYYYCFVRDDIYAFRINYHHDKPNEFQKGGIYKFRGKVLSFGDTKRKFLAMPVKKNRPIIEEDIEDGRIIICL